MFVEDHGNLTVSYFNNGRRAKTLLETRLKVENMALINSKVSILVLLYADKNF